MLVQLGNVAAIEIKRPDPDKDDLERLDVPGRQVTTIGIPSDRSLAEAFSEVCGNNGAWAWHSKDKPAWVACDNDVFAQMLAQHFGCEIVPTIPDGWLEGEAAPMSKKRKEVVPDGTD
jgi:hypothetical protein